MEVLKTSSSPAGADPVATCLRHRSARTVAVVAAALLSLLTTSAGAASRVPARQDHATAPVIIDSSRHGSLGVILVTKNGYTLYFDKSDTASKIACTGGCAAIWPPVVLPKGDHSAKAGKGVAQSSLGVVHRPGGALQVTYAGHPLYRYVQDGAPGQVKGEGVGGFFVVKVSAKKLSAPTTTKPSGGGSSGY